MVVASLTVEHGILRNLYAGQGATVRTAHGTTDWFHTFLTVSIWQGLAQGRELLLLSLLLTYGQEPGTEEVGEPPHQAFQSFQMLDPKSQGTVNLVQTLCSGAGPELAGGATALKEHPL